MLLSMGGCSPGGGGVVHGDCCPLENDIRGDVVRGGGGGVLSSGILSSF